MYLYKSPLEARKNSSGMFNGYWPFNAPLAIRARSRGSLTRFASGGASGQRLGGPFSAIHHHHVQRGNPDMLRPRTASARVGQIYPAGWPAPSTLAM